MRKISGTIAALILTTGFAGAQSVNTAPSPDTRSKCFSSVSSAANDKIREEIGNNEYMLGIDHLLEAVNVKFFEDGRVCGMDSWGIGIEGFSTEKGKIELIFLVLPNDDVEKSNKDTTSDQKSQKEPTSNEQSKEKETSDEESQGEISYERKKKNIYKLFLQNLSGNAVKRQTSDLIFWEGNVSNSDGKIFPFYLKRSHDTVKKPSTSSKEYCGDGECDPLSFVVKIKRVAADLFLNDIKKMPITSVTQSNQLIKCPYLDEPKDDEYCYTGNTWPFEKSHVILMLKRKKYVVSARRGGGDAGIDAESMFLDSDKLISRNFRLNLPVAVPLFHDAITHFFDDTGLEVGEPISKQNSLVWEFKGHRSQFEKKSSPSPSEKSEWWKVRLQVAITELNAGTYVLLVGMPETRIASWALDTVPNDAKFTTELTNDERFLDLQGRLLVAISKEVPMHREMP